MADKIFVQGFRMFGPKQNQPDWVIGDLIIDLEAFKSFINTNRHLLSDYKGKKQLRCRITKGQSGPLISVDTYTKRQGGDPQASPGCTPAPPPAATSEHPDDLPF